MFAIKSCSVILKDLRCNQKIYEQNIIPFSHASFPSKLHKHISTHHRLPCHHFSSSPAFEIEIQKQQANLRTEAIKKKKKKEEK